VREELRPKLVNAVTWIGHFLFKATAVLYKINECKIFSDIYYALQTYIWLSETFYIAVSNYAYNLI